MLFCSICGGKEFNDSIVLWPALVDEWQISPEEEAYINRQQGTHCAHCHSNLRGIALGISVLEALESPRKTLVEYAKSPEAQHLRILDLNGTSASDIFPALPHYTRADYPSVDMHSMPYQDDKFDVVIHSDTLEHVTNPVLALSECRRVLKPGGFVCYTVPIILGRLTRSRAGLPASYHGDPANFNYDFAVHSEFGADAWTYPIKAGFSSIRIHTVDFPAATAISAAK